MTLLVDTESTDRSGTVIRECTPRFRPTRASQTPLDGENNGRQFQFTIGFQGDSLACGQKRV